MGRAPLRIAPRACWLPFLDTYRNYVLRAPREFQLILEEVRQLVG
jgi:hypothetical protein